MSTPSRRTFLALASGAVAVAAIWAAPLGAQERIAVIPVFVVEGILKITHCDSVGGEQIGSDSDEGANTRLAMDFARIAFYQKLALVPADSLASGFKGPETSEHGLAHPRSHVSVR